MTQSLGSNPHIGFKRRLYTGAPLSNQNSTSRPEVSNSFVVPLRTSDSTRKPLSRASAARLAADLGAAYSEREINV